MIAESKFKRFLVEANSKLDEVQDWNEQNISYYFSSVHRSVLFHFSLFN